MAEIGLTVDTPCLEWRNRDGSRPKAYGFLRVDEVVFSAHRHAWITANGPIPNGMEVCHRCDNPPCYRLDHLFIAPRRDNQRDARLKGRYPRTLSRHTSYPYDLALLVHIFRLGMAGAFDEEAAA